MSTEKGRPTSQVVERSDDLVIQLLAETGEWVDHEICEDEATGQKELADCARLYGGVVRFRLVHRWTEIEVLTPVHEATGHPLGTCMACQEFHLATDHSDQEPR